MKCQNGCKTDFKRFSSYSYCNSCNMVGWSFDGIVYPWPKLNKNGITYCNDNNNLMYIKKRKPRFRLDSIVSDLGITGSNEQKLTNLNIDAGKFGLEFKTLRSDIKELKKDEPLLLMCIGDDIEIAADIVPATDISRTIKSEEDQLKKEMIKDIEELKRNFIIQDEKRGFKNSLGLKPEQEKAVKSIISTTSNFTIISLPTGYGKTRIIQTALWALRRQGKGPGLMISPLISLMDDQRNQFSIFSTDIKESGLYLNDDNRLFSNAFLTTAENKKMSQILKELGSDSIDIIGSSPETLLSSITGQKNLIDKLSQLSNPVSTLILDEAHIIGDWGASFRPDFQLIPWIRDRLMAVNPELRIILMSATISKNEEKELKKLLFLTGMKENKISVTKTRRDLSFQLERYDEDTVDFRKIIKNLAKERDEMPKEWNDNQVEGKFRPPALVYTPYKKVLQSELKPIAKEFFSEVRDYTGDTNSISREKTRIEFISNDIDCLLATSAFGMGIDKPDLWITYYIGMPWTLKGLYQAFGRTARRSNWPQENGKLGNPEDWHNGYCLALIPNKPPRNYRASVGIAKSLERLWDMFSHNCIILPNGYIMIEIFENIDRTFWKLSELAIALNPNLENIHELNDESEEDEHEDTSDDYIENLNNSINLDEDDFLLRLAHAKRRKRLYKDRLWVLSCLQRTGDMKFLGIHNHILYGNDTEKTTLQSVLEIDGYNGVISRLNNIPPYQFESPSGTRMRKYAVVCFTKYVGDWSNLVELFIRGHNELHKRHKKGRDELKDFLERSAKGECLRKLFAPTIGLNSNKSSSIKDCKHLNKDGIFCMPCSNCSKKKDFWSTVDYSRKMGWHKVPTKKYIWPNWDNRQEWRKDPDNDNIDLNVKAPNYLVKSLQEIKKIEKNKIDDGTHTIKILTKDDKLVPLMEIESENNNINLLSIINSEFDHERWTRMVYSRLSKELIIFQR